MRRGKGGSGGLVVDAVVVVALRKMREAMWCFAVVASSPGFFRMVRMKGKWEVGLSFGSNGQDEKDNNLV